MSEPLRPGDMVIDLIATSHPTREVRRLVMHASQPRATGVVLKVPGKPDQVRALTDVRPVEPAAQGNLLAAQ